METISIEELAYYRNLLSIEVGDKVEWYIHPYTRSGLIHGEIVDICANESMANAFISVNVGLSRFSVSLFNPTLKKLENDK